MKLERRGGFRGSWAGVRSTPRPVAPELAGYCRTQGWSWSDQGRQGLPGAWLRWGRSNSLERQASADSASSGGLVQPMQYPGGSRNPSKKALRHEDQTDPLHFSPEPLPLEEHAFHAEEHALDTEERALLAYPEPGLPAVWRASPRVRFGESASSTLGG